MKIKTSASVIIRIILWLILLLGGAYYSIVEDLNNYYFNNIPFHITTAIIGYFIILIAFRASATGGRELNRKGRVGNIPRLETNKLVTTGIYSCMRHPMLFGLTLLPLGVALIIGSPTFILKVAPAEMLFIIFMVIIFEEREVKNKFKEEYEAYKKRVPMVSFKKECLKQLINKI
jgi:protein-S-isoprenylcysteine O-methyltransferase Ste14